MGEGEKNPFYFSASSCPRVSVSNGFLLDPLRHRIRQFHSIKEHTTSFAQ